MTESGKRTPRLKGAPLSITPLFIKQDDQVRGLINLLSIAVRLLTLMEFIVRRALKRENAQLVGLHKENPKKPTDKPTTERLLQSFSNTTLTIIRFLDRAVWHVTLLSRSKSASWYCRACLPTSTMAWQRIHHSDHGLREW